MNFNPQNRSAQPKQSESNPKLDRSALTPRPQKQVFLQAR